MLLESSSRAGGVAQVVERLPCKDEALSSNHRTEEKRKKEKERKILLKQF
jgi:hypothetical protein